MCFKRRVKPVNILLVEDNEIDARVIREALKRGIIATDIFIIESGPEAIKFLKKEGPYSEAPTPALILLDLALPEIGGLEILELIRNDLTLNVFRTPVIIISGLEDRQNITGAYNHYANAYILKPKSPEKFLEMFKSVEDFWFKHVKLPLR